MAARRRSSPVDAYAEDVLAGRIVTGPLVRLAAERHVRDLDAGKSRGLRFDHNAAEHALDFFQFLRHSKGEWAGERFDLAAWQSFAVGSIFGWRRADGLRRFRTGYVEVGRKNGKSSVAAGVGTYLFVGDQEPGAEVYTSATKRDQARIVHSEAVRMVKSSPELAPHIMVFKDNLSILGTASKYEPLGADADTLDGLNVHGAIVDEIHAHKTRNLWDVLETATKARRQPMMLGITTAGYDRTSICWELHEYSRRVLEGAIEDDAWFAYIACLDPEDDWADESVWIKANPNLGVSVKLDQLRESAKKAQESIAYRNTFRRLHLNQWTEQHTAWIPMEVWEENAQPVDPEELRGKDCCAGLDLSTTTDITALVLDFKLEGGIHKLLCYFWIPAETVTERSRKDRVPYAAWVQQGLVQATEGNVVDYDVIRAKIIELHDIYRINEFAIDRWNATQLTSQLMAEGYQVLPFGQGFRDMSPATKEFEKLVLGRKLHHGGNPVLRWMMSNVAIKQDPAGNIKPDKAKSTDRIDGVVAAIMAVGRGVIEHPVASAWVIDTG